MSKIRDQEVESFNNRSEVVNDAIQKISINLAQMCLEFDIEHSVIIESLKVAMVQETKKEHPNYSNVQIAARCGVDRRYVSKYLEAPEPQTKQVAQNKIKDVFNEMENVLRNTGSNKIPMFGSVSSFDKICKEKAGAHYTPHAVASELIRLKLIEEDGNYYRLLSSNYIATKSAGVDDYIAPYARSINGITSTVLDNFNAGDGGLKKIQRTIFSTQLPPERVIEVLEEIRVYSDEFIEKSKKAIDDKETTAVMGTYPEVGFGVYTYSEPFRNKVNLIPHVDTRFRKLKPVD